MRNLFLLLFIGSLISGCLGDIVLGGGKPSIPSTKMPQQPMIDPYTGEEIKMWVPKNGMVMSKEWESFARAEEKRCSNDYYRGKKDAQLLPSQRSVYKKLSNGGRVWAYYYYYGEDTPGFDITDWYETIFNIYVRPDGTIYGCIWKKYPLGGSEKYSTSDGINPRTHPPR